ncbi:MAG: MBL fold metallo-hydrolase [Rhodospirillales bacterium]|nr:MBL fold metallo-hydrolase [Rhodospirillales bacterium]
MGFGVKFWGVRGSIAVPSPQHVRYGGNTSCVQVFVGDRCFVLDAGTGIRSLGAEFLKNDVREVNLLLTHTHWDHINGFPFFTPAYSPNNRVHIRAGHLAGKSTIREVLSNQMDHPMFPVPLEAMQANMIMEDFTAGDDFNLYPDVRIRTTPLNHPNNATAYRIEYGGKSICYVTDTEHVPGDLDQRILDLVEGTQIMIYDATYTEDEFPNRIGWGHSTWNEGVKLCRAANVEKLLIFHHEPDHDDDFMDKLAAEARAEWSGAVVAQEGMLVEVD